MAADPRLASRKRRPAHWIAAGAIFATFVAGTVFRVVADRASGAKAAGALAPSAGGEARGESATRAAGAQGVPAFDEAVAGAAAGPSSGTPGGLRAAIAPAAAPAAAGEAALMVRLRGIEDSDAAAALTLAREGESQYPHSSGSAERRMIIVKTLARQGLLADARAEAERYVNEYPGTPWALEVERQTGAHPRIRY